jgi:hypothetical protein
MLVQVYSAALYSLCTDSRTVTANKRAICKAALSILFYLICGVGEKGKTFGKSESISFHSIICFKAVQCHTSIRVVVQLRKAALKGLSK